MATNGPRVSCHSSVSVHFVSVFMKVILYSLFISNTRTFRTFWYVLGSAEWEWPGQNRTIHVLFVVAMWRWSRRFSKREENPDQLTHPTQSQSIDLGSGVSDVYLALLLCLCFLYLLLGDKQENYSHFIWRMIVMYVDKSYELVLPTNTEKKSFIQCSSITSILLCCSCKICTAYCLLID